VISGGPVPGLELFRRGTVLPSVKADLEVPTLWWKALGLYLVLGFGFVHGVILVPQEGSIEPAAEGESPAGARRESLGTFTLRGTSVDTKCFFGVRNPGFSKAHRACSARGIAGGIPPVFRVRDGSGEARYLLLFSPGGEPVNARVPEFVAEPLEIRGEVVRYGDLLALLADPGGYRRLE